MSKKISLSTALILVLLAVLITFQITYLSVNNKYTHELNEILAGQQLYDKLMYVDELYKSSYIGDIDEDKLIDGIMQGYVYGTGDKYAQYMSRDKFAEYMSDLNGDGDGIGVSVIYNADYAAIEVITVMPDSPAEKSGILPGDLIIGVNDEDVSVLGYYGAIAKVKGETGTDVKLILGRFDSTTESYKPVEKSVTRGPYKSVSVMYHMYSNSDIGIIKIIEFNVTTPQQFKDAVADLQSKGAKKFVFDVRYNPGGELMSISEVLDYLLPEGPIIRAVDKSGNEDVLYSDASELVCPMAVLTNENTASAAELFTSALKDYKKAVIVGKTTYGKGTMQSLFKLQDNSAVSISVKMYSPPFSDNYEGIGIVPDIEVEMSSETAQKNIYKITDEEDTQLQAAVKALSN